MTTKSIETTINFYSVFFLSLTAISSIASYFAFEIEPLDALLGSFLVWNVGIRGVFALFANWIPRYADQIAESYGWEKGESIQRELASADGAFGVLGVLSPFFSRGFSIATLIGFTMCTILSEISGLMEVYSHSKPNHKDIRKTIIFGMSLDLGLSIIILLITLLLYNN